MLSVMDLAQHYNKNKGFKAGDVASAAARREPGERCVAAGAVDACKRSHVRQVYRGYIKRGRTILLSDFDH